MMTHHRTTPVLVLFSIVLLLFAGVVAHRELRQPPLDKLQRAMNLLEAARQAQADRSAADTYRSAQKNLTEGRRVMTEVSTSWWPFGSYRLADSLLSESIHQSRAAVSEAGSKQTRREEKMLSDISRLDDSLKVWRDLLDQALPRTDEELLYRSAAFSLHMSANMLEKRQLQAAGEYADTVAAIFRTLQQRHQEHHSSRSQWVRRSQDWAAQAVDESRTSGKTTLIVDKSSRYLYILSAGRVADSMACDLGYNSGCQKKLKGDGATPEGAYHVTRVNRGSKYYLALVLDYPNADDRRRFQANLASGAVPRDAQIGGLIEIHGHGGTGRDWTDGCVAVTDKDMDKLARLATVGTPVTIVRQWEKR
ncbi:MAG: L,D-transpeptidase [candidate division Zixibacteria bacterium]|nr:L,D-transpeptidase [candidate division Zixibacteria bacterium]